VEGSGEDKVGAATEFATNTAAYYDNLITALSTAQKNQI